MDWWKRLFGETPAALPSVDAVRLDLSMSVVEQSRDQRVWRDPAGHVVSVNIVEDPGLPDPITPDTVPAFFRDIAENHQGGLVEAQVIDWRSAPVVEGIYKWRKGPGFVFTAMLIMPVRRAWLVWTLVASEHGITGIREAVVTSQLFAQGALTFDAYEELWAQDPYDAEYRASGRVSRATLRYLSDDAKYDSQFPDHPLSTIRRHLQTILADVEIDAHLRGSTRGES